jgi:hypothetical protein
MKKAIVLFLVTLFAFGSGYAQNKLSGQLTQALQQSGAQDKIDVIITMADQYDGSSLDARTSFLSRKQRTAFVTQELKNFSANSQADLLTLLNEAKGQVSDIQSFWIFNGIACKATPTMIQAIAQRPDVRVVDWDTECPTTGLTFTETESTPRTTLEWNVERIEADQVWTYNGTTGYTGNGVVVAILDSGVHFSHNDLKNSMWTATGFANHGWNYVNGTNNPNETQSNGNGVGTMVAGIVAGQGTSGRQTGVAPGAKIMAVKIAGSTGNVTETRINNGLQFAIEHEADIVLVSAVESNVGSKASYRDKMVNLLNLGVPAFTAAGDDGTIDAPNSIGAPSNCPSPWHNPDETLNQGRSANICVGATNRSELKAGFSSIGPVTWEGVTGYNDYALAAGGHIRPDVMAPGVNITSTSYLDNTSYRSAQGTALAAAHAAGVAALLLEADPNLTPADIDRLLETTAAKCEGLVTKNNFYGAGRINAYDAITALLSTVAAPTNLTATADNNEVTLTWTAASGAASYNIYCNEECIATGVTGTTYTYQTDFSGAHAYCLRAVTANGTLSPKSLYAYVFIDPAGPIVRNLAATVNNDQSQVALTWELPEQTNTLRYGTSETPNGAYGGQNGKQSYWAQRYPSAMLVDYAGTHLDMVSVYFNKYKNTTYTLTLYDGDANGPDQQLFTKSFTVAQSEIGGWKEIPLTTPIAINHNKDLWIVMRDPVANPNSASSGTTANLTYCTIPYNSTGFPALFSTDGINWSTYNNNDAWMMKAHLTTGSYTYNVQRDGVNVATNKTTLSHTDTNVPAGVHYYTVTTNYNNGQNESFPCDPVRANVNTHFTVTFIPGDGTCEVETMTQGGGTGAITLPTATPSALCQSEGYTFAGWCSEIVEGTHTPPTLFPAGYDYIPDDDCTLYAVYKVVQSEYGWKQARSLSAGDQVCIVNQANSVEFDDLEEGNSMASSIGYSTEILGEHPFTAHTRNGGYTLTDAQGRYLNNQEGYLRLSATFYSGCVWTAECIGENIYLRNGSNENAYQLMAKNDGGEILFASVPANDIDDPVYSPIQLYRFKGSEGVYYAHIPGCGTTVNAPIFNPEADGIYMEPLQVSLSCNAQGAAIHYTTDGSTPTASSTTYASPITVNSTVTIKAKAFKDGMTDSPVAQQTYQFPTTYANIADFKDADDPNEIARITSTMTLVYQYERYYYFSDDTGGLLVYDDYHVVNGSFAPGDRINLLQGRYRLDHEQPMLIPLAPLTKTGTGTVPDPAPVTVEALETYYYPMDAMLVQIEDVLFSRSYSLATDDTLDTISFVQDGHSMMLRNRFYALEGDIDNTYHYDVTGLLGVKDDVYYLYPRGDQDIRQYHTITLAETQHGTLQADHEQASHLSTVTLTVTPEANYHLESLYYYGSNPSNHTDIEAPYSFEMPDENITVVAVFAEDVTYTVTFNAGNGTCATSSLEETAWNAGVVLPTAAPSSGCATEGYTFAGWAESFIEEALTAPELFAAGTTYHPTDNVTLYAVYTAASGTEWQDVTTTQDLLEGEYIISSLLTENQKYYYLVREGAVTQNPKARRINGLPSASSEAKNNVWTVKKISSTEYSISYTDANDVTYYLINTNNYAQGNSVTTTPPTRGWTFSNNANYGLVTQFRKATTQRYLDLSGGTGVTAYWYSHSVSTSVNEYKGQLHLFLKPANVYSTNPACQMAVATPEFVGLPEGDYILTDNYMVNLTCSTEGAVIHYTVDGSTPTESSPTFSAPFAINQTCTVNAIAFLEGEPSAMATHAFTFPMQFENIAAFKQAGKDGVITTSTVARIAGDVQFVFRHENMIYLADESAGLLVRDNNGIITHTYNDGDLIQGGLVGTYLNTNQQLMMIPIANPAAGIAGSPVEPLVATADNIKAHYDDYDARLVTIVDAAFTSGYDFSNNPIAPANDHGTAINIHNQFGTVTLSGEAGEHDDITGFVGKFVSAGPIATGIYPRNNDDFVRYYDITCATLELGTVSTTPDHARSGDLVTLNAHPNPGYEIDQWTVTGPNGQSVTVSGNQFEMPAGEVTVSATFQQIDYTVTVIAEPAEGGTVSEGGIYHYGETIQVTATPNPGYKFFRWYVNGTIDTPNASTVYTITGNTELKAVFEATEDHYLIQLVSNGNGTVSGEGNYLSGTTITVTATPDEGSTFLNWTENDVVVSSEASYTFTVTRARTLYANFVTGSGDAEQAVSLSSGWNWWSSSLEMDATLDAALKDAIAAENTTAVIKNVGGNTMLENGTWSPVMALDNESMYMIRVDNAVTATLTAAPADPANHPITLASGWNWIGFPTVNAMTLDEAFAGITPNEEDVVKGTAGPATYTAEYGWNGSLTGLEPGVGYMYKNNGDPMTLVYPSTSKGMVRVVPMERYWMSDTHRHATTMTMLATLDASRYTMTEGNYEIGAFVGDECRGSARLQRVGSQYIAYLSVSGEEGETVRFKLYDVTNNVEQGLAEEQVSYVSNAITGTTHEPVVLHFRGTTDLNEQASQVRVYPNPADDWITIESEALQSATLFTLTGQQLLHEPIQSGSARLNVSALVPGLYLLQLRSADGSTLTRKLEIK